MDGTGLPFAKIIVTIYHHTVRTETLALSLLTIKKLLKSYVHQVICYYSVFVAFC